MYGKASVRDTVPNVEKASLKRTETERSEQGFNWPTQASDGKNETCERIVPDIITFASLLDEEQERELEQELLQVVAKQLPPPAEACTPVLHPQIVDFADCGEICQPEASEAVETLPQALKHTSFAELLQAHSWPINVIASAKMARTVKGKEGHMDAYLRDHVWLISSLTTNTVLLVTPYEMNLLMPSFRCSRQTAQRTCMHMFAPRMSSQQNTFFDNVKFLPALHLYSANLFFATAAEERMYSDFLGLYL